MLPESGTPSPKQPLSRGCLPENRTLCSRYWKTRCAAKASVQPKLSLRAVARNTCFCRQANASWRPLKAMAPACNQLLDPFGAVKGSPQQPQALDDVQQVNFKDISAGFTLPQWGRAFKLSHFNAVATAHRCVAQQILARMALRPLKDLLQSLT